MLKIEIKKKSRLMMVSSASSNFKVSNLCLSEAAVAFVKQAERAAVWCQASFITFLKDFHHRPPRTDEPSSVLSVYPLPLSQFPSVASLSGPLPTASSVSRHPEPSSSLPSAFRASPSIAITVSPLPSATN